MNSAGSCNDKVVKTVQEQAGQLMHTFNYPYTIPQALLAEKVCSITGFDKIFYQNSGTEANEAMIKMARKYGIENTVPANTKSSQQKWDSTAGPLVPCPPQVSRTTAARLDLVP